HFKTRSDLLIELYRWIDSQRVKAFLAGISPESQSLEEAATALSKAYISCVADEDGEFQAVGGALAGNDRRTAVYNELVVASIQMVITVLQPHTTLPPEEFERCCIGLVGAGDAFAAAALRGDCSMTQAIDS